MSPHLLDVDGVSWARMPGVGLYLPPPPPKRKRTRPVAVDLFCGCGGMSLGLHQGGFDVVCACDNDPEATMTYLVNLGTYPVDLRFLSDEDRTRFERSVNREFRAAGWGDKDGFATVPKNWPAKVRSGPPVSGSNAHHLDGPGCGLFFFGDVRKLTGAMILDALGMEQGEIDLVAGGPPCQGFSRMGKRNVMDPRNSLVFEFVRLVLELMPKTLVFENVPGIVSMLTPDGIPVVEAICMALEDGGFGRQDMLRKMIETTSGVGVATKMHPRGSGDRFAGDDPTPDDEDDAEQLSMFGDAA